MTDCVNEYRTYLALAPDHNKTGLPHNVWAMLQVVSDERKQIASNWQSHVHLDKRVKRMEAKEDWA